jgi:hypothetical protein
MRDAALVAALVTAAANALAALAAGWRWWVGEPSRAFWVAVRLGQAAAIALAVVAGVGAVSGFAPADRLFWLYALLPVVVGLVAEQFRAAAAQTVLDARGLPDAQAVGALDEAGQREIVTAVLQREIAVMGLAALVVCFLALRAYGTA